MDVQMRESKTESTRKEEGGKTSKMVGVSRVKNEVQEFSGSTSTHGVHLSVITLLASWCVQVVLGIGIPIPT